MTYASDDECGACDGYSDDASDDEYGDSYYYTDDVDDSRDDSIICRKLSREEFERPLPSRVEPDDDEHRARGRGRAVFERPWRTRTVGPDHSYYGRVHVETSDDECESGARDTYSDDASDDYQHGDSYYYYTDDASDDAYEYGDSYYNTDDDSFCDTIPPPPASFLPPSHVPPPLCCSPSTASSLIKTDSLTLCSSLTQVSRAPPVFGDSKSIVCESVRRNCEGPTGARVWCVETITNDKSEGTQAGHRHRHCPPGPRSH